MRITKLRPPRRCIGTTSVFVFRLLMAGLQLVLGDDGCKFFVFKYRSKPMFGVKAIVAHERRFASIIASKYHDAVGITYLKIFVTGLSI